MCICKVYARLIKHGAGSIDNTNTTSELQSFVRSLTADYNTAAERRDKHRPGTRIHTRRHGHIVQGLLVPGIIVGSPARFGVHLGSLNAQPSIISTAGEVLVFRVLVCKYHLETDHSN